MVCEYSTLASKSNISFCFCMPSLYSIIISNRLLCQTRPMRSAMKKSLWKNPLKYREFPTTYFCSLGAFCMKKNEDWGRNRWKESYKEWKETYNDAY